MAWRGWEKTDQQRSGRGGGSHWCGLYEPLRTARRLRLPSDLITVISLPLPLPIPSSPLLLLTGLCTRRISFFLFTSNFHCVLLQQQQLLLLLLLHTTSVTRSTTGRQTRRVNSTLRMRRRPLDPVLATLLSTMTGWCGTCSEHTRRTCHSRIAVTDSSLLDLCQFGTRNVFWSSSLFVELLVADQSLTAMVNSSSLHFIYPAVQNTNAMRTICNLQQSGRVQQGTKCTATAPCKEK